jgi:hypothetical protein
MSILDEYDPGNIKTYKNLSKNYLVNKKIKATL